ncbi:hypothetical protein H0H81_009121 [Sphagnurus paluster]|uniref:Uncharacterized protein n=1 Tax=Sphagnurus paluster TaxID=117069 RepID=A0A9P7FSA0_9AGAR|nr:hypothetical protein H0H81_009121 [Sphagnurus paluster]
MKQKKQAANFPETVTHAVNFGPRGLSGIGPFTAKNFKGRGVRVIVDSEKGRGDAELFSLLDVKCWSKKWSPSLVRTSKHPIMVAPSTVKASFISAVLDAGYHVELAGGGHYNAAALRSKVAEIQKLIPAEVGITLNTLYIDPRQFTFQFPLWQEEGLPVEGFCVAAGIPTTEKALEIIEGLKAAGIKHVAFKPGT